MFGDTLAITINSVAKTLNKINQDGYAAEYLLKEDVGEYRLKITHKSFKDASGKVTSRHFVDFTHSVYPVAPATLSTTRHAYVVLEDQQGDLSADFLKFALGFMAFFTNANNAKLVNWES
jgi:hypothetical protein